MKVGIRRHTHRLRPGKDPYTRGFFAPGTRSCATLHDKYTREKYVVELFAGGQKFYCLG